MSAGAMGLPGTQLAERGEIHVLHVDDNPLLLELTAEQLLRENENFVVHTASSGAEGLEVLDAEPVDCVVSDYDMPGMDGLAFLEAVRERSSKLPFILFTGKGSEEIAAEAISAGVTDYLQKASGTEQYALLANRIEHAVDGARTERVVEETREWFQTLIERATNLITVLDSEGTIRYQSPAVGESLGYASDRLLGESVTSLLHPEDRADATAAFRRVVDGETDEVTILTRVRDAAGEWHWLEAVVSDRTETPVGGYVVNSRDVTARVEREQELRRTNDLLERTQRLADVGGWEYDVRTDEAWWTPEAGRIHGLDADATDEYAYERAIEQYHPDDRETIRDAFERAVSAGESFDLELRIGTGEGESVRWVRTRGEPQYDDGERVRVRGIVHDITERKRRERDLRREHDRFTTLFENLPNPVAHGVLEAGPTPVARRVNEQFEEVFGSEDRVAGDLRAAVEAAVSDGSGGQPPDEARHTEQLRCETTEGLRDFQVDVVVDTASDPPEGYAIYTDITEQVERERELEIYETVLQSLDDAVYAVDGDGCLVFANDSYVSMKNAPRSALLGSHISEWVEDGVMDRSRALLEAMRRGDRTVGTLEYDLLTADGERIPVELRFVTISLPDGDEGRAGVIRDVSDRVERERQLQAKTDRLERFTSVVSHDLRNPLNVVVGRVELARDTGELAHLDQALDALDRMETLLADLLTLASEGTTDDRTRIDLADFVADCWSGVEADGASIDIGIERGERCVEANETRLRQLFENLFVNAVEHAGSEPSVTVGRLDDGDGFYVADDGPGLDPETGADVFDVGYSTDTVGNGFGLSIVEEVATEHGWQVGFVEDAAGARFEFRGVEWV